MECLVSICREGKGSYYCFSEAKFKLFASVPEGTLKSWVRFLDIQRVKPSQCERDYFRKTIPQYAVAAFQLISEHDLSRLLAHFNERRCTRSLPGNQSAWSPTPFQYMTVQPNLLHDTCDAQTEQLARLSSQWYSHGERPGSTQLNATQTWNYGESMPRAAQTTSYTWHTQESSSNTLQALSSSHVAPCNVGQSLPTQSFDHEIPPPWKLPPLEPQVLVKRPALEERKKEIIDTVEKQQQKQQQQQKKQHQYQQKQKHQAESMELEDESSSSEDEEEDHNDDDDDYYDPCEEEEIKEFDFDTADELDDAHDTKSGKSTESTHQRSNFADGSVSKTYALKLNTLSREAQQEIKELRNFFLEPIDYQRNSAQLCETTIDKTIERLLCFLGFVKHEKNLETELSRVLNLSLVQEYVKFIGDRRSLRSSTLAAHIGSLRHVARFVNRGKAETKKYANGILALQRQLEKCARKEKKLEKAQAEVTRVKKVMFPELLEICRQLVQEFEECSSKFVKARLVHDLLMLLLYCTVNPGRAKEYVTLRIATEEGDVLQKADKNFILFKDDGSKVQLYEGAYKTKEHYGPIVTELGPFKHVCYYLKLYLGTYRSVLLSGKSHSFLFCNTKGDPFTESSYNQYLSRFFERRCSVRLSTNDLRRAVVTYFLSLPESNDVALRESVAAVMKHSVHAQKRYYDERTHSQKKARGLEFFGTKVASAFLGESFAAGSTAKSEDEDSDGCLCELTPTAGDLVALVANDSTAEKPGIYVARVLRISEDRESAILSNYEEVEPMRFKMKAGSSYRDSINALVFPIDIVYNSDDAFYELRTSKMDIHKQVVSKRR